MKLWLDDCRTPPNGWAWAKTAESAIRLLSLGDVEEASLDHDLGSDFGPDEMTGYDVAAWIERWAHAGTLPRMTIRCHSSNPVGRRRIEQAIASAMRAWGESEGCRTKAVDIP